MFQHVWHCNLRYFLTKLNSSGKEMIRFDFYITTASSQFLHLVRVVQYHSQFTLIYRCMAVFTMLTIHVSFRYETWGFFLENFHCTFHNFTPYCTLYILCRCKDTSRLLFTYVFPYEGRNVGLQIPCHHM